MKVLKAIGFAVLLAACATKEIKDYYSPDYPTRGPAQAGNGAPDRGTYERDAYYTNHGDHIAPGDTKAILGRDIWIKATAGDARFFAYVFPQRVAGKSINWPDMLLAEKKRVRFTEYGLINDPDCCSPSVDGECVKKFGRNISEKETFGFDFCQGDETLLKYVGRPDMKYRDPACDVPNDITDANKQSSCDLEFGTSAGAVGLRKFPNPRFRQDDWDRNGGWAGYINYSKDASGLAAIDNHSVEPPFRVGMACAHCHATFSPTNPPANPTFPKWANINTLAGNQYLMDGQIWGSGFRKDHISSQSLSMSRAGTVDTSAVPNDTSGNAGTQNAIINLSRRPLFNEVVDTWRKFSGTCTDKDPRCWCEMPGKCWKKSVNTTPEPVPHVLKGGEDSVGYYPAIQRVYINIGSCSEQCWLNHLTDQTAITRNSRNYGESAFEINQCRRDCPNFRAIEDRVETVGQFFFSARPMDLKDVRTPSGDAIFTNKRERLEQWLENEVQLEGGKRGLGPGSIRLGAQVFARSCATCHSSQAEPGGGFASLVNSEKPEDFFLQQVADPIYAGKMMRADWLGNDKPTSMNVVQTNSCRARHSNHMKGSVYDEYASETYRQRASVPVKVGALNMPAGPPATGGRGYLRNISLLNVWAHAPFMHNNAMGPELCGTESKWPRASNLGSGGGLAQCWPFDPSFNGRFKVYLASMKEMLTPSNRRTQKAMLTTEKVSLELIPEFWKGAHVKGTNNSVTISFPAGVNSQWISSFRHKEFALDFAQYISQAKALAPTALGNLRLTTDYKEGLKKKFGAATADQLIANFAQTARNFLANGMKGEIDLDPTRMNFYLGTYSNCFEQADNLGHDFGTDISEREKNALTAYLALF